jgi:hypothetical protein
MSLRLQTELAVARSIEVSDLQSKFAPDLCSLKMSHFQKLILPIFRRPTEMCHLQRPVSPMYPLTVEVLEVVGWVGVVVGIAIEAPHPPLLLSQPQPVA